MRTYSIVIGLSGFASETMILTISIDHSVNILANGTLAASVQRLYKKNFALLQSGPFWLGH